MNELYDHSNVEQLTTYYFSFIIAHCSLLIAHCPLPIAHRPAPRIHLLTACVSLFHVAGVKLWAVIYNIIASKMETLHNPNPTRSTAEILERGRLILILTGIITAIICSLILLHNA